MDQSKRVAEFFFSLSCRISKVLRVMRDPQSIRNSVAAVGLYHVVKAATVLHDPTLAIQGLLLCILCRVLPNETTSFLLRLFLIGARIGISLSIAFWLNYEDRLQALIQQHLHVYLRTAVLVAVLGGSLLGLEEAAEEHQRRYERRVTLTDSASVKEEMATFSFWNLQRCWVTVELTAVPSFDRASFVAELRNSRNIRIKKIKRHGPLATCKIRLPRGRFHVFVENKRPSGPPLKIHCQITVEERSIPGWRETKTPEPLDTSSLRTTGDQLHEAPTDLQNQLCPSAARATKPPADDPSLIDAANDRVADQPPDPAIEYCFTVSDWQIRIEKLQRPSSEEKHSDLPENAKRRSWFRSRNKPKGPTES